MRTDHIGIRVKDIEVSTRFYCENLDFKVEYRYEDDGLILVFLKNENSIVELIFSKKNDYNLEANGVVNHIAFTVPDIKLYMDKLMENGVIFDTEEPKTLDGKLIIFFKGPDGERLEFVQYLNKSK